MRKIENQINETIKNMESKKLSCRDEVVTLNNVSSVYLWDKCIFTFNHENKRVSFCFRNYETNTTKSRINNLLSEFVNGCNGVFRKNYQLFLRFQGKNIPIDSSKIYFFDFESKTWDF